MTHQNNFLQLIFSSLLAKRALIGAGIGFLLLIILFVIVGAFNDGSWIYLPMLTVPLAGAGGGAFYHVATLVTIRNHWNKFVANAVCLLVYLAGLWLGFVYALSVVGLWD